MATTETKKRHSWTEKQEIQFVKDWQVADSIGELVDSLWDHPAFDDLPTATAEEEEETRLTIANRLQSKAKSIQRRGIRLKEFERSRVIKA